MAKKTIKAKKKILKKKTAPKSTKPSKKTSLKSKPKKALPKKAAVKKTVQKKKSTPKKATAKVQKKLKSKPVPKSTPQKVSFSEPKKVQIDYSKAVTPLGERLVVRCLTTERITPGGLILPDTVSSDEGNYKAVVLAAGHGSKSKKGHLKPLDVQVGDEILFPTYAGTEVQFNQEKLYIVNESDVLGILKK